jgi:tetratricopeptide (TPR) repeat protein
MAAIRIRFVFLALALTSLGCGGDPAASLQDARIAANAAYNEAVTAFASKDYAGAEAKLAAALQANVLNPDVFCDATAKYAVCLAAAGKYPEAMAELDKLGPAAPNQAAIFAARSFILKKQGKVAEANVALAQAKRLDRMIKEF